MQKILVHKETFDNLVSSLKLGSAAGTFTKTTKHDKFLLACRFIKNRKILVLSWFILMGNFTKFHLLKDWYEKSQIFKMWDKSLQDIKNPENLR